jgi:hypothetical protein
MPTFFADDVQTNVRDTDIETEGQLNDIQAGSGKCPNDPHNWMGDNPHTEFEQMRPAVNKKEPSSFANPCEAGAKKASEDVYGKPMPIAGAYT